MTSVAAEHKWRRTGAILVVGIAAIFLALSAAPATAGSDTYADGFPTKSFDGDEGTASWSTDWVESEGDGPHLGAIHVRGGETCTSLCLHIGHGGSNATVERGLDLANASAADLSFTYGVEAPAGDGTVVLAASADGGGSWSTLRTYSLEESVASSFETVSLLPFATANTRIRFSLVDAEGQATLNVDDVLVSYGFNLPPSLDGIGDRMTDEGTELVFTATAADPDGPTGDLNYSIDDASEAAGMSIDRNTGAFDWTPTETQGPGSFPVTVTVTDDGTPAATDSETITITVQEVNQGPTLDPIGDRSAAEDALITFDVTASDPDLPSNPLVFSLSGGPPDGASITPSGTFSWTPSEVQGSGVFTFDIVVSDGAATDTETITIEVDETNRPPVLDPIGDLVAEQSVPLTFTATASDTDDPGNTLTFSLSGGAPGGASIGPASGAFAWTPTAAQTPGTFTFRVVVTDDGDPARSDSETITVTVSELNLPPMLNPITDRTVSEGAKLIFAAGASDPDGPKNALTFSLDGPVPQGASIDARSGRFSWQPTEAQGPGVFDLTMFVTDDGPVAKSDSAAFRVTVLEINEPPVIDQLPDAGAFEGQLLTFSATATDPDVPANSLTFTLEGAVPAGAAISPDGVFTWTPADGQGAATYKFDVVVTDNGTPPLSANARIKVNVVEANNPPVIAHVANQVTIVGETVALQVVVTDPEGDGIEIDVTGLPPGMSFDPESNAIRGMGIAEAVDGSPFAVTITATDDGAPPGAAALEFSWSVHAVDLPPTGGSRIVEVLEDTLVAITLDGADPEGLPVSFRISSPPEFGDFSLGGATVTYTPAADWNGDDALAYTVSDGKNESPVYTITLRVLPVNDPPVPGDDRYDLTSGSSLEVEPDGVLGNDTDPDGDRLDATLEREPRNGTVVMTADGGFRYEPTDGFVGGDSFTYRVTDPSGGSAVATVRLSVAVLPASSILRTEIVAEVLATRDLEEPPPSTPSPERSLVLMSRGPRAPGGAIGTPLLMLVIVAGLAVMLGRIGLVPIARARTRHTGMIRMYEPDAGFGLVTRDADGADVFVHASALRPRRFVPKPGNRVRFRSVEGLHRDIVTRLRPETH